MQEQQLDSLLVHTLAYPSSASINYQDAQQVYNIILHLLNALGNKLTQNTHKDTINTLVNNLEANGTLPKGTFRKSILNNPISNSNRKHVVNLLWRLAYAAVKHKLAKVQDLQTKRLTDIVVHVKGNSADDVAVKAQTRDILNGHVKLRALQIIELTKQHLQDQENWKVLMQNMIHQLVLEAKKAEGYENEKLTVKTDQFVLPDHLNHDFAKFLEISTDILKMKEAFSRHMQGNMHDGVHSVSFPENVENIGVLVESWNDRLENSLSNSKLYKVIVLMLLKADLEVEPKLAGNNEKNIHEVYQVLQSRVHQLESINEQLNGVITYFHSLIGRNKREISAEISTYPVGIDIYFVSS
jgi:hypothetical protein